MILAKIAFRNLTRQKRRSVLLGGALSFGMCILVIINGVTGGLIASLQKNFSGLVAGDVFFLQAEKGDDGRLVSVSRDDTELLKAIKASKIRYTAVTRRTVTSGSVIYSGDYANRQIAGVRWEDEPEFGRNLDIVAGNTRSMAGSDGIVISDALAESVGLIQRKNLTYAEGAALKREIKVRWKEGGKRFDLEREISRETAALVKTRAAKQALDAEKAIGETVLVKLKTINGQDNVAEFRVAAIFRTQMDYSAYVDREILDSCLGMPEGSFTICGIALENFANLDGKTAKIYAALKDRFDLVPYSKISGKRTSEVLLDLEDERFTGQKTIVTNLNNELGPIVGILTAVQQGSFFLFLAILAVIMVGLVNTFRIVVYERMREIGTMRALGAQRNEIRNLFLCEAVFLGVAGIVPGFCVGIAALFTIRIFRFEAFPELAFFLDGGHLAFAVSPLILAGSAFTVIIVTLLAAVFPARKAARMEPAKALRTQL